jgi:hypothetical protein
VPAFLTLQDTPAALEPSLAELLAQAEGYGADHAKLLAARSYPKVTALEQLTSAQRQDLAARMAERFGAQPPAASAAKAPLNPLTPPSARR